MSNDTTSTEENERQWTIMVYLAGKNSLAAECIFSITELSRVGPAKNIDCIVQLDSVVYDGTTLEITHKGRPRPGEINVRIKQAQRSNPVVAAIRQAPHLGKKNRRQPKLRVSYFDEIFNFVARCVKDYSAQHYMLVLSGHGSGTVGDFLRKDQADKIDSLSIPSLGKLIENIHTKLLKNRKKLDILGMDSCLMSMTEVAYAAHKHADVMIGAEGFEPMAGWPYASILQSVNGFGPVTGGYKLQDVKALAKQIVSDYIAYYSDYQAAAVSVDQAACDLSQSAMLMEAVKCLSDLLCGYMPAPNGKDDDDVRNALLLAHWEAQPYKNEQYTDLYDFCNLLQRYCPTNQQNIVKACQNVKNVIRGSANEQNGAEADKDFRSVVDPFVLRSCYSGLTVQYSYGVSIYFPWAEQPADLADYEKLYFARDSHWGRFLNAYLRATKREVRPGRISGPHQFTPNQTSSLFDADLASIGSGNRFDIASRYTTDDRHTTDDRGLSNLIGTMRNPPTDFYDCSDCPLDSHEKVTTEVGASVNEKGSHKVRRRTIKK